jgi:hypothetical protein
MSENVVQHDQEVEAQGGPFDPRKYTNNPELHFRDIRNELYRIYIFPPPKIGWPNTEIRVDDPEAVSFKAPDGSWQAGGSHRVVTKSGKSVYIPAGWIGMYWEKAKNAGKFAYEW